MTRHEKIDKILLHMSKNMGEIPTRPDLIAKNANLEIEKSEAYLILNMLDSDGYAKRIMATNKVTGEESDPHFVFLWDNYFSSTKEKLKKELEELTFEIGTFNELKQDL